MLHELLVDALPVSQFVVLASDKDGTVRAAYLDKESNTFLIGTSVMNNFRQLFLVRAVLFYIIISFCFFSQLIFRIDRFQINFTFFF